MIIYSKVIEHYRTISYLNLIFLFQRILGNVCVLMKFLEARHARTWKMLLPDMLCVLVGSLAKFRLLQTP